MTFEELLDQATALLQRRGRVSYRTLQRQFNLDDAALEDLKDAILFAHPQVVDEGGRGLVWPEAPAPTTTSSTNATLSCSNGRVYDRRPAAEPSGARPQCTQ